MGSIYRINSHRRKPLQIEGTGLEMVYNSRAALEIFTCCAEMDDCYDDTVLYFEIVLRGRDVKFSGQESDDCRR